MTRWQFWLAQWILLLAFVIAFIDVITPSGGNASASIATIIIGFILAGIFFAWGHTASKLAKLQEIQSHSIEKRKRERLDNVLRDLSDKELIRLKQRLSAGTIDDEMLYERLVDDEILMEKH